ncbi:hypothetical protein Clacol_007535 [Clathrus columnatus]|uniref:Histone H1 n=1 Tax=Clathrus columnatus TaxID=1419009 RepID=A0AAV5AKR1_9AGAM|nr:hypothetical protein Clacol_007535 [Clathrus columnatus]
MPEQQASPSCSQLQPLPPASENISVSEQQTNESTRSSSSESAKRTYLSLLPPLQLIDLILAVDVNRETTIFPLDLDNAIRALQQPRQSTPSASVGPPSEKDATTGPVTTLHVKAEPDIIAVPPPLPPLEQTSLPAPAPPVVNPAVPPPYPPPHKLQPQPQPQPVPQMYSYAHTPYYVPPAVPVPPKPPQTPSSSSPVPPPSAPVRHPLFTSAPLTRDPTKSSATKSTPPPTLVSSRDDPNAMPSYEEMLVEAIMDVGDVDGTAPKVLFTWMASHYPLQQNFRPSASQALHKALKRGRLEKIGGKYRLNPAWGGGPTTSKRATRRPTAHNVTMSPPASAPPAATPVPTFPTTIYHPTYGYHYATHPPHPYYPNGWIPGQPIPVPVVQTPAPGKTEQPDEMEGVLRSEQVNPIDTTSTPEDPSSKERMRQSLIRLARVLKRFAKKGEGTGTEISTSNWS